MIEHLRPNKNNPGKTQPVITRKPNPNEQLIQEVDSSATRQTILTPRLMTSSHVLQLQHIIGNAAVQRVLTGTTIQRRGENPYASTASHDGWELTAHHIVGHSKLTDAFDLLTDEQKKDILKRSIPVVLDKTMLENVKVKVPDDADEQYFKNIRARLVDMDDKNEVQGVKIDDIRHSFFEWQRGNQYAGPNTSIRTEPTSEKSDMDFDGQYFSDNFQALNKAGKGLYSDLDARKKLKEDDRSGLDKNRDAIYERLKTILDVTVNKSNDDFDPAQWHEIGTLSELNALAANKNLNRPHLLNYAFFKIPTTDTHMHSTQVEAKYDQLRATNAGNSEFSFGSIKQISSQAKFPNIFIPIEDSKNQIPTQDVQKSFRTILDELKIPLTPNDDKFQAVIPKKMGFSNNQMLRLNGYTGQILHSGKNGDQFTFTASQLATNLTAPVPAKSLYNYLKEKDAPTSSYLPKALYDKIKSISNFEQLISQAENKEWKFDREVNRIAQIKKPTPNQVKRMNLFTRKRDQAIKDQVSYKAHLVKLRKLV